MSLSRLGVETFRCFESLDVELNPGLNVVYGDNASGKTSVLEAMFMLGRGRSFRVARKRALARNGGDRFAVYGRVTDTDGVREPVGLAWQTGRLEVRVQGRVARGVAELARLLPVQVIDPHSHLLVEGGPEYRRRFVDWGVFHVEHRFMDEWGRYQRALRQRNASLRSGGDAGVWDRELAATGTALDSMRRVYVESLAPQIDDAAGRVLGAGRIGLAYRAGWAGDQSLAEALASSREEDRRRGFTTLGPHRADLDMSIDGYPVGQRISRGQEKVLAACMLLAQVKLQRQTGRRPGLMLVDDVAAELGQEYLRGVLELIREVGGQRVLTVIDPDSLESTLDEPHSMFHVEHGGLAKVV